MGWEAGMYKLALRPSQIPLICFDGFKPWKGSDMQLDAAQIEAALAARNLLEVATATARDRLLLAQPEVLAYSIPVPRDEPGADAPEIDPMQPVVVRPLTGPRALRAVSGVLSRLRRRANQPPTRVDRLPAVVSTRDSRFTMAINGLNAAKEAFATTYRGLDRQLLDDPDAQHLHLLQCYRKVPIYRGPVKAVTFGWTSASTVIDQLSKDQVLRLITHSAGDTRVDPWVALVEENPSPFFARVRRVPPTPIVQVRFTDAHADRMGMKSPWASRVQASLPVFLVDTPLAEVDITPLQDYTPKPDPLASTGGAHPRFRSQRPRLLEDQPLIAPLNLYAYRVEALTTMLKRRSLRQPDAPA